MITPRRPRFAPGAAGTPKDMNGRFTVVGKLVSYDGDEETVVQLPASTFRLRRHR